VREAKQQAAEQVDQEVKRRLKEFYKQQELEDTETKAGRENRTGIGRSCRQASVNEVQEVANKRFERYLKKIRHGGIEELEKRLIAQIQQTTPGSEMIQAETERKNNSEWGISQDEGGTKNTLRKELMQQMEKERETLLEREHEKTKQQEIDAYRMLMKLMMQLAVPAEMPVLASSISKKYPSPSAIPSIWKWSARYRWALISMRCEHFGQIGKPTDEDSIHLKNLQQFFKISDDEHIFHYQAN